MTEAAIVVQTKGFITNGNPIKVVEARETLPLKCPIVVSTKHPTEKMKAVEWQGKRDVKVVERPRPTITEPGDAIIKITTSAICGSDLHLYNGEPRGAMHKGDVLGHECMGIIKEIGKEVYKFKVGDRVVVSAVISCGKCIYCTKGLVSCCDTTNPSKEIQRLYGHRISGIFGYSHLTGGYEGGQAEFIRVPLADNNLLQIPPNLPDEKAVFLSDIVCTGWHANVLGCVNEGNVVAIWGCGPVGLMTAMWAKFRKAARIVMIDGEKYRLDFAKEKLGVETIDFNEGNVPELLFKLLGSHGPDITIECVGFRYPKTVTHQVQKSLQLETDVSEILTECIISCRKGGNLACIGDYFEYTNNFPIGALMEKMITFRGGQVCVQTYWKELLGYIEKGYVDPTFVITHAVPLERAEEAYRMFDEHRDDVVKVLLKPTLTTGQQ